MENWLKNGVFNTFIYTIPHFFIFFNIIFDLSQKICYNIKSLFNNSFDRGHLGRQEVKIMFNIAILGFGTVGQGTYEVLTQNASIIEKRVGDRINIKYILDLRDFPDHPYGDRVVHDYSVILNDPEIDLVAEMMGGSHPAYDFSKAALMEGKHVVTSNKEVVANFGVELLQIARENGVCYLFEASVGGGIPIIRPMINDLAQNRIISVSGILNGTTNYILTQMSEFGADFSETLKDAHAKGYAEANPAADIEGTDAARKIAILASLAYGKMIPVSMVHTEGITKITTADIEAAKSLGCAIKLIGHTCEIDGRIFIAVTPRLVSERDPLHGVCGVFNGISVDTDMLGRAMFYGRGAGKLPTASAVVADIIDAAMNGESATAPCSITSADAECVYPFEEYVCEVVYRFTDGSLKKVTEREADAFTGEGVGAVSRLRML